MIDWVFGCLSKAPDESTKGRKNDQVEIDEVYFEDRVPVWGLLVDCEETALSLFSIPYLSNHHKLA